MSAATAGSARQVRGPVLDAAEVRARVLADVTAERHVQTARMAQAQADLAAIAAAADRLRAEHAAACEEARALHTKMPPEPEIPDASAAQELVHRLTRERGELNARERETLAAAVGEVQAAWDQARPALDARAAELLAAADALARRYAAWWDLVYQAREADEHRPNARTTNGLSTRMGQRPDALAVLAAGRGADLCAAAPLTSAEWEPLRLHVQQSR